MATEYGLKFLDGHTTWYGGDSRREELERVVKGEAGFTLVAREVSEPRIVSIRA